MRYAMILRNNVIGVVESDTPPKWGDSPEGYPVIAMECDETIELGMVYDEETGEFTEYIPPKYVPTQADRIEEMVNMIANGTTAENTEAINALLGV